MLPPNLYARVHLSSMRKQHMGPRVRHAPGLPCALYFEEGQTKMQTSDAMRREIADAHSLSSPGLVRNCALGPGDPVFQRRQ